MRSTHLQAIAAAVVVAASFVVGGCASTPNVQVNTTVAPDARFGAYRTFTILTPRMTGANPAAADEPMVENSIVNRALREDIRQDLESRGYRPGGPDADFAVAYYTAARTALDVTTVDYGYPYRPWWWGARERQEIQPITQGTVVIDVIDRRSNRLVWRGTGRTEVSQDQNTYMKQLQQAINDVVKKLPQRST